MTNLNLTAKSGCGCGCGHDAALPELEARSIPHAVRHAAIHGVVDSLQPGGAFVLVAPHDPLPLLAQVQQRHGDSIQVTYVEEGPEVWKLKLARV